ncbi:hypothetical protein BST92_05000 [Nonlabens arenilitoris]|uniref:Phage abortive infection protein n=1 Tax=Nonlabens arenilitoris TaxID=1217969 RepID=A0A2S7U9M5_9FLAO|nr:hypothetical protein [Nonlabens arenilitoris]PQJ31320.1 hypothetical protein BST92_05000 [Nonlabens arenilitoris]
MKKLFKKNKTAILISTIGILVLLNIISYTKLWTNLETYFDSKVFNEIATPIATIIAVIIYYGALKSTQNQNAITKSNNDKNYFEEIIKEYQDKAKSTSVKYHNDYSNKSINFTELVEEVIINIDTMIYNEDYQSDLKLLSNGETLTHYNMKLRSYKKEYSFLSKIFTGKSRMSFFIQDIIELLKDIDSSNLTKDDKKILSKKIIRIFIGDYTKFFDEKYSIYPNNTLIPIQTVGKNLRIDFVPIYETPFLKNIKEIKEYQK